MLSKKRCRLVISCYTLFPALSCYCWVQHGERNRDQSEFLGAQQNSKKRENVFLVRKLRVHVSIKRQFFFFGNVFLLPFQNCAFQILLGCHVVFLTVLTVPVNLWSLAESSNQLSDALSRVRRGVWILVWLVPTMQLLNATSPQVVCTLPKDTWSQADLLRWNACMTFLNCGWTHKWPPCSQLR